MVNVGIRFVIAIVLLMALGYFYEQKFVQFLLPLIGRELNWLDDSYRVTNLVLANKDADIVIRLDATLARYIVHGNYVIAPDPRGHAMVTTLAASVVRPAIFALGLIAAWPALNIRQYILRLIVVLPLLLLLLPVDVPFVLLGELWELVIARSPDGSFSPLIAWKDFMQGGGRLALALSAALLSVYITEKISGPFSFVRGE